MARLLLCLGGMDDLTTMVLPLDPDCLEYALESALERRSALRVPIRLLAPLGAVTILGHEVPRFVTGFHRQN